MTKGILKRHSLSGVSVASTASSNTDAALDKSPRLKRVSFDGAEPARVFEADEWDRSPAEVTLRLSYKDVVELKELNVSVVRTGLLMMERTPSRRPTRQRTPTPPSLQPSSPARASPSRPSSVHLTFDDPLPPVPSPLLAPTSPRLSPTYQYQPFASQSLSPLLEDASSSPVTPSPARRNRGHSASVPDSYFTFHPVSPPDSPPGLPLVTPRLKGVPSPVLVPPSPLTLTSFTPPRSPRLQSAARPGSPVPAYLQTGIRPTSPHVKSQSTSSTPKSRSFPLLARRASVPEKLALDAGQDALPDPSLAKDSPSPTWKPMGLAGVNANSSSPSLSPNKPSFGSPAVGSALAKRSGMSLMGWELRRTGSVNGKRGFGLVRKGNTGV